MYEQHFGLAKRPFSVKATGTEVFVGPQTAKTMVGFRKALVAQDAVVTVSGPVGTGKSTLVERALDAIGTKYKTIRVGRMQMNSSDVLEALLVVLGVQERPAGTIQRFAALRRRLRELQDAETRVFILVEDAPRAGVETLAELEALTVGDAGESDGASIVLMGDETLFEFMRDPRLARLQQRVRRRHLINPLCVAEMLGYLKHSFRSAGGDYERIFDVHSAELVHYLSEGIPRVANNIVDAVLAAAAAEGLETVPATLIARITSEEFGLSAEGFEFSTPEPAPDVVEETGSRPALEASEQLAAQPGTAAYAVDAPAPLSEPVADTLREPPAKPESRTETVDEPAVEINVEREAASEPSPEDSPEASIEERHLIDNTLPDLAILSQHYATLPDEDIQAGRETVSEALTEASDHAGPGTAATPDAAHELLKRRPESAGENGGAVTRGLSPEPTAAAEEQASQSNALEPPAPRAPVAENNPSEETDPMAVSSERVDIPELDPEPIAAAPSGPDKTPRLEPAFVQAAMLDTDDIPELDPEPIAAAPSEPDEIPRLEPDSVPATPLDTDDIPELRPEPIAAAPSEPDSIPTLEPDSMPETASTAENVPAIEANPVAASIFAPDDIPQRTADSKPAVESDAARIPEPAPEPIAATRIEPDNMPEQPLGVAPASESDVDDVSEPEAEPLAATEAMAVAPEDLIHETEKSKDRVAGNALELERTPETVLGSDPAPDTTPGQQMTAESPEWDRDPTFAQLKPDLEALEKAMALAHREPAISTKLEDAEVAPESNADSVVEHDDIPEITLDKSIETGLQDQLIEEPADIQPPRAKKPDVELERIAANIANAKTLEDMDDIMAETLFGTGISMIAAQIKLNPPSDNPADGETHAFADTSQIGPEAEADLQLMAETSQSGAEADSDLQLVAETPQRDAAAEADLQLVAETPPKQGPAEPLVQPTKPSPAVAMQREDISMETPAQAFNGGLIPSATQRLKTVRALNAAMNTSPRKRGKATNKGALDASNEPQPIEDQINTSITQTLKALEISEHLIDDEPEEETKRGFFSRFRKSKG